MPGEGGPGRSGRAIVLHPVLRGAPSAPRTAEACLEEAVGLAGAISLDVTEARTIGVTRPQPATLLGGGAVEELRQRVEEDKADLVVVDHALTPVQQRNLERAWKTKVIDRSGLILEIFGERARTREGQLQVDLAHLTYQRSRLVRSWTHLERQRGGAGFLGGPGERQIELDRRMIDDRILRLKRDLEEVRRTRGLQREARQRGALPVVALVGYTNAGKSTLFNRLTAADVVAADMLFATLDPTMRAIRLPDGMRAVLSDTVGFISDLPTHLVAAFRATLEEVQAAAIILHVRDISHPDAEAQRADVAAVLRDLGIDADQDPRIIEVLNKVDRLDEAGQAALAVPSEVPPTRVPVSARTGAGIAPLQRAIAAKLDAGRREIEIRLSAADGKTLAWVHAHGRVLARQDEPEGFARLRVRLDPADIARLRTQMAEGGEGGGSLLSE